MLSLTTLSPDVDPELDFKTGPVFVKLPTSNPLSEVLEMTRNLSVSSDLSAGLMPLDTFTHVSNPLMSTYGESLSPSYPLSSGSSSTGYPDPISSMPDDGQDPLGVEKAIDLETFVKRAGSQETALVSMWREKRLTHEHNGQLWRLVEKQRATLAALQAQLDIITRERDSYKQKMEDYLRLEKNNGSGTPIVPAGSQAEGQQRSAALEHEEGPATKSTGTTKGGVLPKPTRKPPPKPLNLGRTLTHKEEPRRKEVPLEEPEELELPERGRRRTREDDERARIAATMSEYQTHPASKSAPPLALPEYDDGLSYNYGENSYSAGLPFIEDMTPRALPIPPIRAPVNTAALDGTQAEIRPQSVEVAPKKAPNYEVTPWEVADRSIESVLQSRLPQTATVASFPPVGDIAPAPLTAIPKELSRELARDCNDQTSVGTPARNRALTARLVLDKLSTGVGLFPGLPSSPRPTTASSKRMFFAENDGDTSMPSSASDLRSSPPSTSTLDQPRLVGMAVPHTSPVPANLESTLAQEKANTGLSHFPDKLYTVLRSNSTGELLPPEALESIFVKVSSSRLRPSRQSMMNGGKITDDDYVLLLGLHSKGDNYQLWRLEKSASSLASLHAELAECNKRARRGHPLPFKAVDRSLFVGHAPSKVEARRIAIDQYFEKLLQFVFEGMDASGKSKLSTYLSRDVIASSAPNDSNKSVPSVQGNSDSIGSDANIPANGRSLHKEGYLTKRGKNFGGWKSRYFVLEAGELRYYDYYGGVCLGMIVLSDSCVVRQAIGMDEGSQAEQDPNAQDYRHAFIILEGRKKTKTKHVLCAENSDEREEWVAALSLHTEVVGPISPPGGANGAEGQSQKHHYQLPSFKYPDNKAIDAPSSMAASHLTVEGERNEDGQAELLSPASGAVAKDKKRNVLLGLRNRIPRDARKTMTAISSQFTSGGPSQAHESLMVFGVPVGEAINNLQYLNVNSEGLPTPVYRCIAYLRTRHAEMADGIFRLSGSNQLVRAIRSRFDRNGDLDLSSDMFEGESIDCHVIAGLLKLYFRELPAPVMSAEMTSGIIKSPEASTEERIGSVAECVSRLEYYNALLLMKLMGLLRLVVDHERYNRMNVRNVGIVFAPTLNIPSPIISTMINHWERVFEGVPGFDMNDITPDESPLPEEFQQTYLVAPPPDVRLSAPSPEAQSFSREVSSSLSMFQSSTGPSLRVSHSPARSNSRESTGSGRGPIVGAPMGPTQLLQLNTAPTDAQGAPIDMNFFDLGMPIGVNGVDFTPIMATPTLNQAHNGMGSMSMFDFSSGLTPPTATTELEDLTPGSRGLFARESIGGQTSLFYANASPGGSTKASNRASFFAGSERKASMGGGVSSQLLAAPGPGSTQSSGLRSPFLHRNGSGAGFGLYTTPPRVSVQTGEGAGERSSVSGSASGTPVGGMPPERRSRRNSTLALLGLRNGQTQEDSPLKKRGLWKRDRERDMAIVREEAE